jgi:CheY-like chemotaxis protein
MAQPTVLIVDDDPAIRKMLVEVLALEGYPTETATNGQEALNLLVKSGPRIILLDYFMPVMDGRGVVTQLEGDPLSRSRHKIILVSAFTNLETVRDLEVDGTLPKPFTVVQLLSVLEPLAQSIA